MVFIKRLKMDGLVLNLEAKEEDIVNLVLVISAEKHTKRVVLIKVGALKREGYLLYKNEHREDAVVAINQGNPLENLVVLEKIEAPEDVNYLLLNIY